MRDYYFKVEHEYQFETLKALALAKNISMCSVYIKEGYEEWPYFVYAVKEREILGSSHTEHRIKVNFEEMCTLLSGTPKIIKIKLNDKYIAEINNNTQNITVGCQEIPFSKVKEIMDVIESFDK
jgi:hypothetical protein